MIYTTNQRPKVLYYQPKAQGSVNHVETKPSDETKEEVYMGSVAWSKKCRIDWSDCDSHGIIAVRYSEVLGWQNWIQHALPAFVGCNLLVMQATPPIEHYCRGPACEIPLLSLVSCKGGHCVMQKVMSSLIDQSHSNLCT